jgi:phytol kinase
MDDPFRERTILFALALAWVVAAFVLVGRLKRRRGWRTGDTRKLFHFLIFGGAALVQWRAGFGGACIYGSAVSAALLFALLRGEGDPWFEALARESDAPHRAWYVVVPWFATALGGLAANLCFPRHAIFGYLAVGLADAVAEPVGIRFGRHRYRVALPRLLEGPVVSYRSLEGSAAVFVAAVAAGACALAMLMGSGAPPAAASSWIAASGRLAAFAAACTLVEAVAPHGWDNLLIQFAASAAAFALFPI